MALDPVKNFAKVTVSGVGYDDAAVSIQLSSGHGSRLPQPSDDGAFNLTWWNATDYSDPSDDPLREIVRCTARAADLITVTRAQENTSASDKNTSGKVYQMVLSPTAKTITDIETEISDAVTEHVAASDPHTQYQKESEKGQANGYASLGSDSKVPSAQLPDISITDTFVVASEVAMLALSAQVGDVAVRSDLNKTYILKTADATVLANWQELFTPTDSVLSVAGKTGAVSLDKNDVGLGNVDNTSDVNKPVSVAQQTALDLKKDKVEKEVSILDDMQTEDWTHTGTGAFSFDTSDFLSGAKSAKLVTAGGGTGASDYIYKNIALTKDPKKTTYIEVDVKFESAIHVSRFYLALFSSVSSNKYRTAQLEATGRKQVPEGDWITLRAAMHCFDPSSGETIESIGDIFERLRFQVSDDGTPITVHIGAIRMVEVPKKAYVCLTFDDSNKSVFTKALPIMQKYGIRGTCFNIKENVALGDGGSAQYMTTEQVKILEKLGWCNGIHGQSPTDAGWENLTEEQLIKYITDSINYWKANDITSGLDTVAYPNGNYGGDYDGYIYRVAKKFFKLGRGTNTGVTEPFNEPTNPLVLHTGKKLYFGAVTASDIISYLQRLADEGGIGVIPGHDIVDSGASGNDVLTSDFQSVIEKIDELQQDGSLIPITFSQLRDMISSRKIEEMEPFGSYIGHPNATGTDADVQGANRAWFRETIVKAPVKISTLGCAVTAQAGNICLGLYDENGKLLATTGSVACPAIGAAYIAVTTPVIIQKGRYYLALVADTITTCKFRETATYLLGGGYRKDSFFPLADLAGRVDTETYADNRAFAIVGK